MSEQISEQISALLDGELPEAELSLLLRQIEKQPEVLQQAQALQQTRLCLHGEQPATSLAQAAQFTTRLNEAIRAEPEHQLEQPFPSYDLGNSHILAGQLGVATSLSQAADTNSPERFVDAHVSAHVSTQAEGNTDIDFARNKWRPLYGAGVAAAVALVAVSAWQSRPDQSSISPVPVKASVDKSVNGASKQALGQSVTQLSNSVVPAVNRVNTLASVNPETSAYTVPDFSELNVDKPLANGDHVHQVKYSTYLLQNHVAPSSTGDQLSRYAQQLRESRAQTQQFFIDPVTGQVVISIKRTNGNPDQ